MPSRGIRPVWLTQVGLFATLTSQPTAAQYDPPADYYAAVTGNPGTLKSELHLIISDNYWTSLTGPGGAFQPDGSGHRASDYEAAKSSLPIVDRDPNNPGNVILAYNGASVPGPWTSGGTIWNREHRWPVSWGLGDGDGSTNIDHNDIHQLTACNPTINGSRSNNPFGTVLSSGGYGNSGGFWYPGDNDVLNPDFANDTGDAARMTFYMAVRYDGAEANTMDLELRNGTQGQVGNVYYGGDLASALTWHFRDVPSTHERRRNHLIFSSADNPTYHQGNRNPFADRPEYVWAIFGDGANGSKLYVGDVEPADGASAMTIDLGRVKAGDPVPPAHAVTLRKIGADPTYLEVTTAGSAASSVAGRYNAFGTNSASLSIDVGLATSTATPGIKSGTVTIDNLDLTSEGTGRGSLDGNDVITLTLEVVACHTPSVDADGDGDVDQSDYGVFQGCFTGAGDPEGMLSSAPPACVCMDVSGPAGQGDQDVGPLDFDIFTDCLQNGGPGVPTDPDCAS